MYIDSDQKGRLVGILVFLLMIVPTCYAIVVVVSNIVVVFCLSVIAGWLATLVSTRISSRVSRHFRMKYWGAPREKK